MNVSISSSLSTEEAAPAQSSAHPSERSRPAAEGPDDSVTISQSAQIHLFERQGESLSQIAVDMNISTATVDGYLEIFPAKTAAAASAETTASVA